MKRFYLILFLMCICFTINAEKQLVIWFLDGSKISFALSEKPKMNFQSGNCFRIYCNDQGYGNFYLDDVARFTYEDIEDSAIKNIENDKDSSFKLDGELIVFHSLKAGDTVSVYTIAGAMVFTRTVEKTGDYSFPLSRLEKGIYIVKVNDLTHKIEMK